jgi:uncharacterized protein YkvS
VKGKFDLSGNPTITDNGITLRLKRLYSNTKITIGELTVDGDPSVRLLTVELKKGTEEQARENCVTITKDRNPCSACKDTTCFRINKGTYNFELNTQDYTTRPQHRYKSLRLITEGNPAAGKRKGILVHTGWNYGFTEGCILTVSYGDVQKIIDDPQNYLNTITGTIKSIIAYDFGKQTMITFAKAQPNIRDKSRITFSGFTGYTGYNDTTFTATKINDNSIVIDLTFHKEAVAQKATFIAEMGDAVKGVNWDNSAPTTMSLYEYVEKHVPDGTVKGKIVIAEDAETVDIPPDTTSQTILEILSSWVDWIRWNN